MIQIVKLVCGDDVIANVEEQRDDNFLLKNPLRLVVMPQSLHLMPISLTAEDVVIHKSHIVFMAKPFDDIVMAYQEKTGSIVTPPESKLVL